jgi:hypothetical protein
VGGGTGKENGIAFLLYDRKMGTRGGSFGEQVNGTVMEHNPNSGF